MSLLFTSYLVVTAVEMLVTGWVSSRIGAKRTLLVGLALIVVFAALAGTAGHRRHVGFRAGWGLGNALFIATASPSSSVGQRRLRRCDHPVRDGARLGIAIGPLLGGELGSISWRGPFFGVAA